MGGGGQDIAKKDKGWSPKPHMPPPQLGLAHMAGGVFQTLLPNLGLDTDRLPGQ